MNAEYFTNKALTLYHLKEYKDAAVECEKANKINDKSARNWHTLGNINQALK